MLGKTALAATTAISLIICLVACSTPGNDAQPADAQEAILAAFDKYDVVAGLGVANKETDDMLLALVRNPAFPQMVNDIVVECANSRYQRPNNATTHRRRK